MDVIQCQHWPVIPRYELLISSKEVAADMNSPLQYLEDHPTASNPGDRKSPSVGSYFSVGELTVSSQLLTNHDPWDDPRAPKIRKAPHLAPNQLPLTGDHAMVEFNKLIRHLGATRLEPHRKNMKKRKDHCDMWLRWRMASFLEPF